MGLVALAPQNEDSLNTIEVLERIAQKDDISLDYHALNAMLNLYDDQGRIQFSMDKKAARQYFLKHVNQNFLHKIILKTIFNAISRN